MKQSATAMDGYVGSRIRQRRLHMDVTQETLAKALGITFQQVQKYEKGANRVSSSRMQQIADALSCPVAYFFEDATDGAGVAVPEADLLTPEGVRLLRAFQKI